MVSGPYVGGLAARAVFLMSSQATFREKDSYIANTVEAVGALQNSWYNERTGLWKTTGWWNAANVLVTLADFVNVAPEQAVTAQYNIPAMIENTFVKAQTTPVRTKKTIAPDGMVASSYELDPSWIHDDAVDDDWTSFIADINTRDLEDRGIEARGFNNFINDYYDDEGWWALALIHASNLGDKVPHPQKYLAAAEVIFEDMKKGQSKCGGIYWSKTTKYTNAIANELYLSIAAQLANHVPGKRDYYLNIAKAQWTWFKSSGLINKDNLINDGLTGDCKNNGMQQWTYNQGVVLGGLVGLYRATGEPSYLDDAMKIATAAISLKSKDGILWEGCEPNCGADGSQFKGAFIRGLKYLQTARPNEAVRNFILRNADSIWSNDRNPSKNRLGPSWPGPFHHPASAGTHSSAMDALVAAVAVR